MAQSKTQRLFFTHNNNSFLSCSLVCTSNVLIAVPIYAVALSDTPGLAARQAAASTCGFFSPGTLIASNSIDSVTLLDSILMTLV